VIAELVHQLADIHAWALVDGRWWGLISWSVHGQLNGGGVGNLNCSAWQHPATWQPPRQSAQTADAAALRTFPRGLSDPYYLGIVPFKGEQHPGRHEALVTRELFDRVQSVLTVRAAKTGERQRQHHHYLKSLVWCGRCHDHGIESRLIYVRANGRGGEYWYFMCAARQRGQCDSPYMRAEDVEETVQAHYATPAPR
jgi:cytochrome c553